MKKIFTITLVILLCILLFIPSISYAELIDDDDDEGIVDDKIEIGDFQYKILSEEECTIEIYSKHVFMGGNGEPIRIEGTTKPSIEILENPIVINGKEYTITSIGEGTFYGYEEISDIVIPNTITNIGAYAFGSCANLKNVTIPESVLTIGLNAFQKTTNLVINVYTGSAAEIFAKQNGIPVVLLDEGEKDENGDNKGEEDKGEENKDQDNKNEENKDNDIKDEENKNEGNKDDNIKDNETSDKEEIKNNQTVGYITIDNPDISLEGNELDKNSNIYEEMTKELKESGYTQIYCAYELTANGEIPQDGIELTFEVGIENNGKEALIIHKKNSGEYETFKVIVENGQVKIKVKELSPFMLAIKEKDKNSNTTDTTTPTPDKVDRPIDDEPPTGVMDYTIVASMIAIISLGGIILIKSKK